MAFRLTPSFQKNAAPLQSYVKKAGAGVTPNASLSAMSSQVPRVDLRNQNVAPKMTGGVAPSPSRRSGGGGSGMFKLGGRNPIVGYPFDPLFLSLMSKATGGK